MVYRGKGKPKNKTYVRKAVVAAPKTKSALDSEIKKIVKGEAETKYNMTNTLVNKVNITSGAAIIEPLNGIAEGVTDATRIGSSIKAKNIKIRLQFYNNYAFTATSNFCTLVRVMIVREKPALGSLLGLGSLIATATPLPVSPLNYSARAIKDRYFILYDKCFTVGNQNVNNGQVFVNIDKKLNFSTYYRGVTAAGTEIDQNSLSMVIMTDNVSTNALNANYSYVFEYTDA